MSLFWSLEYLLSSPSCQHFVHFRFVLHLLFIHQINLEAAYLASDLVYQQVINLFLSVSRDIRLAADRGDRQPLPPMAPKQEVPATPVPKTEKSDHDAGSQTKCDGKPVDEVNDFDVVVVGVLL